MPRGHRKVKPVAVFFFFQNQSLEEVLSLKLRSKVRKPPKKCAANLCPCMRQCDKVAKVMSSISNDTAACAAHSALRTQGPNELTHLSPTPKTIL